jgi:hypothetical protein
MPPTTTTLAYLLSAIRIPFGIALFSAPTLTTSLFALPPATSPLALLGLRMVGTRDLVLGSLLLRALLRNPTTTISASSVKRGENNAASEEDSLLVQNGECDGKARAQSSKVELVRSALVAGAVVDTLDVCAAFIGYVEGSLEGQSALTVGIAAAVIADLGWVCLWRGVEGDVGRGTTREA